MKRFINDIKNHYKYLVYAATAELKTEVAGSYLGWIWWFLEPLCFMLVYAFMTVTVFKANEQYILAFVFILYSILLGAGLYSFWLFLSIIVLVSHYDGGDIYER